MLQLSAPSRCPAIPLKARSSLWICSIFAAKDALDLDCWVSFAAQVDAGHFETALQRKHIQNYPMFARHLEGTRDTGSRWSKRTTYQKHESWPLTEVDSGIFLIAVHPTMAPGLIQIHADSHTTRLNCQRAGIVKPSQFPFKSEREAVAFLPSFHA